MIILTLEKFREYCLSKPGTSEDMPFGPGTLVIRVGGKIFALVNVDASQLSFNLKCDPVLAMDLREKYPSVKPGYHMNKLHWNTVTVDGTIPGDELYRMIDHSYQLVFDGLTRVEKTRILADSGK